MDLKAGSRLRSTACSTEIVVIRAPAEPLDIRCGGAPMVHIGTEQPASSAIDVAGPGTQIGKRYADEEMGIEVLCTKAGEGSLALGDRILPIKAAKPLPSSD